MKSDNPILSIDTKKKEKLGNLYRDGQVYCTQAIETYDHDYPHLAKGIIVPHGIYDMKRNEALISIGLENETAEFICDSIKKWWNKLGKKYYPNASEILIFCDAGGANSYRHNVFKVALQNLATALNLTLRICHYPPYTSKWNPIEHRVFPHVSRAMEGVKLESVKDAKKLIENTETKTGLNVVVHTINKIYKTGIKVAKEVLDKINITKHGELGQLNYTIAPMEVGVGNARVISCIYLRCQILLIGAVCVNCAHTDLCGGHQVTGVPTVPLVLSKITTIISSLIPIIPKFLE